VIIWSGVLWALMGSLLIGGVWYEKTWAKRFLLGVAAVYTVWYWGENLFWKISRPNWAFAVILNLVLIVFIIYTTKLPTREAYERES
jgi:hypothetical protein